MGCGPLDGPSRKVFLDELPQFIVFFRTQGIYFGHLRFECQFEFNCVVPETMFRELLRPSFAENIEIGMMCLGDTFLEVGCVNFSL